MVSFAKIKGQVVESKALQFLENQGLSIIQKNYTANAGEIDLIMRDNDTLVFVEVRYRKSNRWGSAVETIDYRKQARIIAASHCYLQKNYFSGPIRFDIITYDKYTDKPSHWIKNAFEASW